MKNKIIITTEEELREIIADCVRGQLKSLIPKEEEELLTVNEVADLFGVTAVTIHSWKKKKILAFHRIGGRVRFKKSEIMEKLSTHNKYYRI
ncbi:MAG: helix-turn-helix domain-containing protein [Bacteroidota bacterium]